MLNSDPYRPWLPQSAFENGAVDELLAEWLDGWSRKWLARRPLRPARNVGKVDCGAGNSEHRWHVLEEGLAIGVSDAFRTSLGIEMLDLQDDEQPLAPRDRPVAEALADAALEDLRERALRMLRLPEDSPWRAHEAWEPEWYGGAFVCHAQIAPGEAALEIRLEPGLMADLVKAAVRAAPSPVVLQPVEQALALQEVEVSAALGTCELPLAEIAGLCPGDVVVLDRDAAAPVELSVGGSSRSGRCELAAAADRLTLQVTQPFFE